MLLYYHLFVLAHILIISKPNRAKEAGMEAIGRGVPKVQEESII